MTSTKEDFFVEQLLLSIFTLRQHNEHLDICVLTDSNTLTTFDSERNLSSAKVEPMVVDCPAGLTPKERSRFLEFAMRKTICGDLLYIDSDTVVTDSLDGLDNLQGHIFAVRDKHTKTITPPVESVIKKSKLNFPEKYDYFNSGLIFSRDTPESSKFFDDWKNLWMEYKTGSFCLDQPGFNYSNIINGNIINELDGVWNCQIFRNGAKFLPYAKVIHYYSVNDKNNPYILARRWFFQKIRDNHYAIPTELSEMLVKPKSLIFPTSRIITRENQIELLDSSIFECLSEKLIPHKLFFKTVNKICSYFC